LSIKNIPLTADEVQAKVQTLRDKLVEVVLPFAEENPELPAQAIMAGLGELLIQLSVPQVGPQMTVKFLGDLQEAVRRFSPSVN
jgi:hypothetical protein